MLPLLLVFFFGVDRMTQTTVADVVEDDRSPAVEAIDPAGVAAPVLPLSLVEFMGRHGCTFTPARDVATRLAGFDPFEVDLLITTSLANGTARQEGDYVVLGAEICTIVLPEIETPYGVDDPFIKSITSEPDFYLKENAQYAGEDGFREMDYLGCFMPQASIAFDEQVGGGVPGAGWDAYIDFIGARLIAGDVRYYSDSPLSTPLSFQVMTGPGCDSVPNAGFVAASHSVLVSQFGSYIRMLGEGTSCGDGPEYINPLLLGVELQGADMSINAPLDSNINTALFFEWDLIAMAAGWHEGMTGTQRGEPRPPLCHYPTD